MKRVPAVLRLLYRKLSRPKSCLKIIYYSDKQTEMLRRIIFSITTLFSVAQAASISPFYSLEQKRIAFSYTDESYEDTRLDLNADGKVDFWIIKDSKFIIRVSFLQDRSVYHIRKFDGSQVFERVVISANNKLYLSYVQDRKQRVYNMGPPALLCSANHVTEWEKLKETFSSVSKSTIRGCFKNYADKSCATNVAQQEEIRKALEALYSPPYSLLNNENQILNCLESSDAKNLFVKRYGKSNGSAEHEQIIVNYKNTIIKFLDYAKEGKKPIISCKESGTPKASEGGQILLILNSEGENQSSQGTPKIKEQIFHESIHTQAVEDEEITKALTDLCIDSVKAENISLKPIDTSMNNKSILPSTLDAENAGKKADLKESDAIPSAVAETPKSLPIQGSPTNMNRLADSGGKEKVAEVSKAQTSGVVRMAESVLGSTPAVAAEPSTSLASSSSTASGSGPSSSGSSSSSSSSYASSPSYSASSTSSSDDSRPARRVSDSSRSPASEYQLDMSTVGAKAPTVKIAASANGNGLGKGEYIKEEVDLTKPAVTTGSSVGRVPASTKAGSSDVSTSTPLQTNNTEQTSSSGSGNYETSGRGAASANLGSGSQSSNGSTSTSPQRRGTSSQTAGGSYVPSRDEVVSFFSGGSYQQARGKLKDQGFVQTLKQNNITVYDLGGNTYGASKGEIIFVDQGDRFVRQK
ncbi:hypothetical protein [Bdellovibrio bacteriovorus]|uniref:hypothetical protein n=1 Tax=Bdellovibrio bacteriovorus TaxID=959 RepID=UPI0035A8EE7D